MKDLLEPLLYPHNIVLYGLLLACLAYKKKGLWLLLFFYYFMGNTWLTNQVRQWYLDYSKSVPAMAASTLKYPDLYVVLGCGGSQSALPACAQARLAQLVKEIPQEANTAPLAVLITTRYCQPYLAQLQQRQRNWALDCVDAGANTYQELDYIAKRYGKNQGLRFITSDFHGWRVKQLIQQYQLQGSVGVVSTQTFRPVNCHWNCLFTVNLTNFDFYSKLIAEFSSYAVYRIGGARFTGVASD